MTGPAITTDRLELWQPAAGDEAEMFAIMQAPAVWRHFGAPVARADHATRFYRNAGSWMLRGYGSFMVRERGRPAIVGNCGVFHSWRGMGPDFDDRPEAGWILAEHCMGMGLAHEAMEAAFAWFDRVHGPQAIGAMIAIGNAPSFALARRLGFVETRAATLPVTGEAMQLLRRDPA